MMKAQSFQFIYHVFFNRAGGVCDVDIYTVGTTNGRLKIVVLTERADNPGASLLVGGGNAHK